MQVCICVYEGLAFHSVALLAYLLKQEGITVVYAAEAQGAYVTKEGLKIEVSEKVSQINPDAFDGIIIPGGDPVFSAEQPELKRMLLAFREKKKLIGSICAGTNILAEYGLLEHARYTSSFDFSAFFGRIIGKNLKKSVVCHENLITARGQALIEFALQYLRALHAVPLSEMIRLYRRYKPVKYKISWRLKKYDRNGIEPEGCAMD